MWVILGLPTLRTMDRTGACTFAHAGMGLVPARLCSKGREGAILSLEQGGRQTDPRRPWPLKGVLVPSPTGNCAGQNGRKLRINALQISSLQKCLCFPTA